MSGKFQAVVKLLQARGPEKDVSKRWLFRTGSRLDRKFRETVPYTFTDFKNCSQLVVQDQIFLWPNSSPRAVILEIASEIMTPDHPHQYQWGPTKVGPDDVVLDIGACEGAFSALVTAKAKRVIAIEPSYAMCDVIRDLFELRKEPCPQIINCLLGPEPSKAYFLQHPINPGASRISDTPVPGAYEVPVKTLDEAVEEMEMKPTFIKCDAEGAEIGIFSGGKNFLKEFHPKLAITTYHNETDYDTLYDMFKSLGYRVMGKGFLFSQGTLRVHMIHAW